MNFKCNGTTINLVEFDKVYPIGSIYMNLTNPDNPATYLGGGTWESFGQGRILIGAGTGNDDTTEMTFSAGSTGGEYNHALINNELPSHAHGVYIQNTVGNPQAFAPKWTIALPNSWQQYKADTTLFAPSSQAVGGNQSHNNIQPYITVYMWKRTA